MHVVVMPAVGPLFAAGLDWIETLLPILFFAGWILSQVVNVVRKVGGEAARPQPVPPRRRVPGEPPAEVRHDLERQIEEFLRQARGEQKPADDQTARPRPAAKPARPDAGAGRQKPPRPAAPQPKTLPPVSRQKPAASRGGAPPRLADRHLEPLGASGDDVVEHVRDAFSKPLGQLESPLAEVPATTAARPAAGGEAAAAGGIAAELRDPVALRRLILMREILERPVQRWE